MMKITPLAAESMRTRSMATLVETDDVKILIDPAANLGENRYGLSPHPMEAYFLKKQNERIDLFALLAEVFIITHYHYDHFNPRIPQFYEGKILFLKNPNQGINTSQRKRAFAFLEKVRGVSREINFVDGRTIEMGKTRIVFSNPLPHGLETRMGYVISVFVSDANTSFLFSSDVQGPCRQEAADFILELNPEVLYLDGPATYLHGMDDVRRVLEQTHYHLEQIIEKTRVHTIIIDHHLTRDLHWEEKIRPVLAMAERKDVAILTAAEMRGEENHFLEARRRQLYQEDPPS